MYRDDSRPWFVYLKPELDQVHQAVRRLQLSRVHLFFRFPPRVLTMNPARRSPARAPFAVSRARVRPRISVTPVRRPLTAHRTCDGTHHPIGVSAVPGAQPSQRRTRWKDNPCMSRPHVRAMGAQHAKCTLFLALVAEDSVGLIDSPSTGEFSWVTPPPFSPSPAIAGEPATATVRPFRQLTRKNISTRTAPSRPFLHLFSNILIAMRLPVTSPRGHGAAGK